MNKRQIREARQLLDGYLIDEEVPTLQTYKLFHDIYEKNLLPIKYLNIKTKRKIKRACAPFIS